MHDYFDFDSLETIVVPVRYQGKQYELREASAFAAMSYRDAILKGAEIGKDGPRRIGSIAGAELVLLSFCLFNGDGKSVPVEELHKWPDRVTSPLAAECKRISHMNRVETADQLRKQLADVEADEANAKNSTSDTTDG